MITRYFFKFYRETDSAADYNDEFVDSIVVIVQASITAVKLNG